jgi:DNA-binding NarL/FixJ family response regulator
MKFLIVDDNEHYREGLKFYLKKIGFDNIIAEYADGEELLKSDAFYHADIILMDIMMPNVDGYAAAKYVIEEKPSASIIAVTMFQEKAYLLDLIQTGFKACVYKLNIYNELPKAIEAVSQGKLYFPEEILIKK